jgi:hypothetical protein
MNNTQRLEKLSATDPAAKAELARQNLRRGMMLVFVGQGWTAYRCQGQYERALEMARGCYQTDLLLGHEAWSGSTLVGKAREWKPRYQESSGNLLARIRAAGIKANIHRINRRHVLVIG